MPNNWKTYKLSDALEIKYGKDHKKVQDGNIPIYGTGGIMRYGNQALYDKETILIPRKGSLNNIFYLNEPFWSVDTIFWSKINEEVAFPKYLFYNLKVLDFASMDVGSAIPSLTTELLKKIEIELPSLTEQQSIASILSSIDDKIENNLAINKTLEEMAMALYKHWFVDFGPFQDGEFVESELGMIPKGWEVKSVYDIATYVNGAAFKPSELIEEGKYVIKISELNGGISKNTGKSVKEVKPEQIIKDGSVLFSWSATLDIFLWDKGEALLNQHIFNVLPNNTLSKEVLYFLLKNIIAYFKAIAADRATTMGHIKITHLKETLISIPNKEIQIEIDSLFKPLFDQILENLTENQSLTQLRDTLLPQLISGAVRLKEFRE